MSIKALYNKSNFMISLVILLFMLKGIFYAVYIVPPTLGVSPDDVGHFSYIQYIAEEKRLPILNQTNMSDLANKIYEDYYVNGIVNSDIDILKTTFDGNDNKNWIAQHPPLYYLLLAPIYIIIKLFSSNFIFILLGLRIFTLLFGCVTLIYMKKLLEKLNAGNVVKNSIYMLFLFSPPIQFYFSNVTNDSLLICLCVAALYYLIKYCQGNLEKDYYIFVVICAFIILTKYTGGLILLGYILYFIYRSYKDNGIEKTFLMCAKGGLLGLLLLSLLLGRNLYLHGELFPISGDVIETYYDISFFEFLFKVGFVSDILKNFVMLIGSKDFIRPLDINLIIVDIILLICAVGSALSYHTNRKKFLYEICIVTFFIILLYSFRIPPLLCIEAGLYLFILINYLNSNMPAYKKEISHFFTLSLLIMVLIFLREHYAACLKYGAIRATHGRYYYIGLFPFLYIMTNGLDNIRNNLFKKIVPIFFMILLICGELVVIQQCLNTF